MIKVKFFLVCFFALFVSCAYCQNYSYAINVGLSKKNAKMTDGFSFETCSYYSYNRKLKKYLFDQQYSTKTNFIFTSNPRLIYEFNLESGQLADCYCERRGSLFVWDCNYDYIHSMIALKNPKDFSLEIKGNDIYFYFDKNLLGRYRQLIVYENYNVTEM
jgi:hypothetical protein